MLNHAEVLIKPVHPADVEIVSLSDDEMHEFAEVHAGSQGDPA